MPIDPQGSSLGLANRRKDGGSGGGRPKQKMSATGLEFAKDAFFFSS